MRLTVFCSAVENESSSLCKIIYDIPNRAESTSSSLYFSWFYNNAGVVKSLIIQNLANKSA